MNAIPSIQLTGEGVEDWAKRAMSRLRHDKAFNASLRVLMTGDNTDHPANKAMVHFMSDVMTIDDKTFATLQARAALDGNQLLRTDSRDGVIRYILTRQGPPERCLVQQLPAGDVERFLGTS